MKHIVHPQGKMLKEKLHVVQLVSHRGLSFFTFIKNGSWLQVWEGCQIARQLLMPVSAEKTDDHVEVQMKKNKKLFLLTKTKNRTALDDTVL